MHDGTQGKVVSGSRTNDRPDVQDVIEAEHWIRDHETTAWPFSSICEVLGIESTSFTRSLLTWHDRPTDAAPRALGRHNRSTRRLKS